MGLLKIVAIIAVVVALAVVAIYLCGQFEQTRFIYDGANNLVSTVTKTATDNPAITATVGSGAVATAGGAVLNKFNSVKQGASSAVEKVSGEKDELASQLSAATDKAKGLEDQVADYKKQLESTTVDTSAVTDLKKQLGTAQESLFDVQQQKASLQNQLEEKASELKTLQTRYDELRKLTAVP